MYVAKMVTEVPGQQRNIKQLPWQQLDYVPWSICLGLMENQETYKKNIGIYI